MSAADRLSLRFKFGTASCQSTTELVAVSYLMDILRQGILDLNPSYQRESVWKTEEKSSYVSAVIAGAPAGKIVIVRDGNRWKTIDGKQRVDAFAVWFDGGCAAYDVDGVRWSWKPRRGCKLVPENERDKIMAIKFIVVRYSELSDDDQRRLFQALQQGRRLTTGQRLHGALSTSRKQLSDKCYEAYRKRFVEEFGFYPTRGPVFELLVIHSVHMLVSQHRSFISIQPMLKWLSTPDRIAQRSQDRVLECFQVMFHALVLPEARLVNEDQGAYTLSPVEVILTVLFAEDVILAGRKHERLAFAGAIRELRERLRRQFAGVVRCNDSVLKHGIKFIRTWLRSRPPVMVKGEDGDTKRTVSDRRQSRKRLPLPPDSEIIDLTGDEY